MIPALRDAEYVRYGVMHRNTYLTRPGFSTAFTSCAASHGSPLPAR